MPFSPLFQYNQGMRTYLGTWQVAPSDGFWTDQGIAESEKTLSSAVKLGVTGFDTAQSYGKGRSEQTLSKVLRRHPDKVFTIDTKIMPSTRDVRDVLKVSLDRLRPFSIDCLYLHWPRSGFDNRAYLQEMESLREEGTVEKVGVCNLPLEDLERLLERGIRIDRIQRPVSLLWTRELHETEVFCKENGIELAAYSPAGMGLLSGRYRFPEDLKDARAELFCFREPCLKAYHELLDLLGEIAKRKACSNHSIALFWVFKRNPDIVVLGARNECQLEEDLDRGIDLDGSEFSDLEEAARRLDIASMDVCTNIFSYRW